MSITPVVTLNPIGFAEELNRALDGHLADYRNIARAVADGSFAEQAQNASANTVMQVSLSEDSAAVAAQSAAKRAAAACFMGTIGAFITFLDRMIMIERVVKQGGIQIKQDLKGADAILEYAQKYVEAEYQKVARDTKLTNPKKIAELGPDAATVAVAESLFGLRRCIEHHGSIPERDLEVKTRVTALFADNVEITSLPHELSEGQSLRLGIVDRSKTYPAGTKIALSESEVTDLALTMRFLAAEIADMVRIKGNPPPAQP